MFSLLTTVLLVTAAVSVCAHKKETDGIENEEKEKEGEEEQEVERKLGEKNEEEGEEEKKKLDEKKKEKDVLMWVFVEVLSLPPEEQVFYVD